MNRRIAAFCAFMLVFFIAFTVYFNQNVYGAGQFAFARADDNLDVKTVYLTFDDGPSDRVTPKILDILEKENVKATFFIIGRQAELRESIVKRIHEDGHGIGVHSYTHEYGSIYSSPQALIADINRCNEVIYKITGEHSSVYRFPGGSYGLRAELIKAVSDHGLRYVDWNASVRDAEIWQPTAYQLFRAAITTSADANNVVLLAHDSTTKLTTAEALPDIIKYYKDKGYSFSRF